MFGWYKWSITWQTSHFRIAKTTQQTSNQTKNTVHCMKSTPMALTTPFPFPDRPGSRRARGLAGSVEVSVPCQARQQWNLTGGCGRDCHDQLEDSVGRGGGYGRGWAKSVWRHFVLQSFCKMAIVLDQVIFSTTRNSYVVTDVLRPTIPSPVMTHY